MAELIVGAVATTGLLLVMQFARKRQLAVAWWQWGLTVLAFLYSVLVLEVVVAFLREGSSKGAMVVGTILGFVAVVWIVLLARFVFVRRAAPHSAREQ